MSFLQFSQLQISGIDFFFLNAVCLAYLTIDMLPAKFILDIKIRITTGGFLRLSYF